MLSFISLNISITLVEGVATKVTSQPLFTAYHRVERKLMIIPAYSAKNNKEKKKKRKKKQREKVNHESINLSHCRPKRHAS